MSTLIFKLAMPNRASWNGRWSGEEWRAARAMGYRKLITYTLPREGGASLRGAGFKVVAETKGGSWNCASRPRVDMHPTVLL